MRPEPAQTAHQRAHIEAANRRLERWTGWFGRVLPFRRLRPLDRIPSIKLKLSILIVAAIAVTVAMSTIAYWFAVRPRWAVAAAVVSALVMVQILARGITAPLREMTAAADRMAAGDLHQRVADTGADEIGQLGRAFNEMAAHIAELERQRTELIANVSHELRTPLAVVQGNIENLLDGVAGDERASLEVMLRQTRRLGRLVAQLLDLSRLEAGQATLDVVEVDLADVLADVVDEARLRDPAPPVELSVVDGPLLLDADPERLHQVVANLVDNAVRHSPAGAPVTIAAERRRDDGEDVVVLSVVDRGPGIPAAERDAVFERYHSGQDGGTGLGLSIARWIVELHGGQVLVHDASPGSRFEVILPMAREAIR